MLCERKMAGAPSQVVVVTRLPGGQLIGRQRERGVLDGLLTADRQVDATVRPLGRPDRLRERRGREARLQRVERLALVRGEARHVHQPGDPGRYPRHGHHGAAVGMPDEDHGPVELVDHGADVGRVGLQASQRVRRCEDAPAVAGEPLVEGPPAGGVGERAVHEDNRGAGHLGLLHRGAGSRDAARARCSRHHTIAPSLRGEIASSCDIATDATVGRCRRCR
jgi:hypothetical protein